MISRAGHICDVQEPLLDVLNLGVHVASWHACAARLVARAALRAGIRALAEASESARRESIEYVVGAGSGRSRR